MLRRAEHCLDEAICGRPGGADIHSIAGRDLEREIVPLLESEKVGLLVWSPLAGGLLLVGCHGLRVTAGLVWMAVMMAQVAIKGLYHPTVERRLLCFSLFWHALDIVWVWLFTAGYLVRGLRILFSLDISQKKADETENIIMGCLPRYRFLRMLRSGNYSNPLLVGCSSVPPMR